MRKMTAGELADTRPLRFIRYNRKLYAQTPAGEIAYGEGTGLYEWRYGRRIHYSGGDRQGSRNGQMLREGPGGENRPRQDWPHYKGFLAALSAARLN